MVGAKVTVGLSHALRIPFVDEIALHFINPLFQGVAQGVDQGVVEGILKDQCMPPIKYHQRSVSYQAVSK